MKLKIVNLLKNIYNLIPSKKIKQKIKNKIYYSNKLSNIFMYHEKHHEGYKYNDTYTQQVQFFDGKIAVSLNINEKSNLKILKGFLSQIPYNFDLYIHSDKNIDYKALTKGNIYINRCYFNLVEADVLKTNLLLTKYDKEDYKYVLNVNTCLKHYSEEEMISLIDREYILKNLIYIMNYNNNKIINLSTIDDITCDLTLSNMNFDLFLDKIINMQLNSNDFIYNKDKKRIINSISLVDVDFISECINKFSDDCKISDYIFNKTNKLLAIKNNLGVVNYNFDSSEFYNYKLKQNHFNLNDLVDVSKEFDIISFDIFDTLVARKIYSPDDLFDLMNINIPDVDNFKEIRKKAEMSARNKCGHDVNINEIYSEMSELFKIEKIKTDKYKNMEINYERQLIIPRKDMLNYYFKMKKLGKKIILVSDMYLTKDILEEILINIGIRDYDDIIISNEVDCRKDNGTMWDYVNSKYNGRILHIGDNLNSDIYQALKHNIFAFKIDSGIELSNKQIKLENNNIYDSVMYGNIINNYLYNSPFYNNELLNINDYYDYGICVLSPIFICFYSWLLNIITNNKKQHLLFVARDGYYLKKMYEHVLNSTKYEDIKDVKYDYFLTSRRASSIASINSEDDLYEILQTDYNGTLKDLFYYRYGVKMDVENKEIHLPKDIEMVKEIVKNNKQIFLEEAKNEKDAYLKYIYSVEPKVEDNTLSFVDLGYSGTTQYYISKLLDKKTNGYYFLTSNNLKPLKLNCNVDSCFSKNAEVKEYLYAKSLFLESFLTAPFGQLEKFIFDKNNVMPIYNNSENSAIADELDLLYKSIIDMMDLFMNYNIDIRNINITQVNIYNLFKTFVSQINDGNYQFLNKLFKFEDYYCNNGIIDVSKR